MFDESYVKFITKKVKEAENVVITRYNNGTIKDEDAITSQIAAEIESKVNKSKYGNEGIITAKVYSRRKEEKLMGADLGVILDVNGRIQKAFLAQAKKGTYHKGYLKIINRNTLAVQCQRMLSTSSDSFIFIYTSNGVFVTTAFGCRNAYLYHKNLGRFFSEFLKCFIGDHKIIDIVKRPEIILKIANHVLYLRVKDRGDLELIK